MGCQDPNLVAPMNKPPQVQSSPNDIFDYKQLDGKKMTIAVYNFGDKTGQRKQSNGTALLSSAVTQGAEVWVIKASDLTDEQKQQFIIKDNLSFGDWDYDILANEWDSVELEDWGLNVWQNEDDVIANTDEAEPVEKDKIVCALCGK